VIGYCAGNEVSLTPGAVNNPAFNAPCQKKFIRDMRAYVQSCKGMRPIPIGLAVADHFLVDNALYYNCRTDANDKLENTEYYGINQYRDCEGQAKSPEEFVGFRTLFDELKALKIPVPLIYTEFGCLSPSYPTIDGYKGQRTFGQIDALFQPNYLTEVTGGIVFEYSTEKANSIPLWPFKETGAGNYGVVYFTPESCDDIAISCKVVRFPQFQFLADAYARVPDLVPPSGDGRPDSTTCPANYPALKSLTWASDRQASQKCPSVTSFQCPVSTTCGGAAAATTTTPPARGSTSTTITTTTATPAKPINNAFGSSVIAPPPGLPPSIVSPPATPLVMPKNPITNAVMQEALPASAKCAGYPACAHLWGDCCPTVEGMFMDCCRE
jgi:1,3-beta-glucanosyltransferase GAS5